MKKNIIYTTSLLILLSCNNESEIKKIAELPQTGRISTELGDIQVKLAIKESDQIQGLSGVKDSEMSESDAMLFFYMDTVPRRFWMPDTYFDLDIFFLDRDLVVIDVERDIKHHVGRENEALIPTTRTIIARHVLEMKASSKISKSIKIGDRLKWASDVPLSQIELSIRQSR